MLAARLLTDREQLVRPVFAAPVKITKRYLLRRHAATSRLTPKRSFGGSWGSPSHQEGEQQKNNREKTLGDFFPPGKSCNIYTTVTRFPQPYRRGPINNWGRGEEPTWEQCHQSSVFHTSTDPADTR